MNVKRLVGHTHINRLDKMGYNAINKPHGHNRGQQQHHYADQDVFHETQDTLLMSDFLGVPAQIN